jgi:hypothetical protein
MGTTWQVTIASETNQDLRSAIQTELDLVDKLMSTWRDDSEISRFNASDKTDWFPVSKPTAAVVQAALDISAASDGAFDVTVSPLIDLWTFDRNTGRGDVPDAAAIKVTRKQIGWQQLSVRPDPPALKKSVATLSVNLSAIATIDPRTGRPGEHALASVTVLAESCMVADAWATAISVLGPEAGSRLVQQQGLTANLIVRTDAGFQDETLGNFPTVDAAPAEPVSPSSMWPVFLAAAIVFLLAIGGMAVGVIISNRRLKGSCGGLAGMKDGAGQTACDLCAIPSAECRGEGAQAQAESTETPVGSKANDVTMPSVVGFGQIRALQPATQQQANNKPANHEVQRQVRSGRHAD